ncbi:MAG TPA: ATP-grasp domain-containing protein, partial [Anaerolineae bacterium]
GDSIAGLGMTGSSFKSPHVKLLNPSPNVSRTLTVSGFIMFLEVYSDREQAIASFVEAETQPLALLQDKRILFVMGSYPGKRPMYERARELGLKLVVLDGPGHWTQAAVQEGLFEQFIEVDLHPHHSLADRAYQAIQASGLHFDGIATFEEFAGALTALLAQGLGLPGHPFLAASFSRDKMLTREVCMEAGIPSPRFARIKSIDDLEAAAGQVGFPAVLKPVSGASSAAAYRVDDEQQLRQRYTQTMAVAQGPLKTSGVHSDDEQELVWASGFDMILEAYLDGEEFDVDCLLSAGEMVYAAVTHDWPQPYLREVGAEMPPLFPVEKQEEMVRLTREILKVLGFVNGVFHVEVKYTGNGPRLIEVNARLGGGTRYQMNKAIWGVDLVDQYLMSALNMPIRPDKAALPLAGVAESWLPCPASGVIARTDFLESLAGSPHVLYQKLSVKTGQRVVGPGDGIPDSLGLVLVQSDTVEEAVRILNELISRVEVPLQQGDGSTVSVKIQG